MTRHDPQEITSAVSVAMTCELLVVMAIMIGAAVATNTQAILAAIAEWVQ